jgi:EAL domain-containing protein (putative c-di-GMP-specific phosphodiesterase class I)
VAFILYCLAAWKADAATDASWALRLEALIRWNHPERGTIAPGRFIIEITESVLMDDPTLLLKPMSPPIHRVVELSPSRSFENAAKLRKKLGISNRLGRRNARWPSRTIL